MSKEYDAKKQFRVDDDIYAEVIRVRELLPLKPTIGSLGNAALKIGIEQIRKDNKLAPSSNHK